MGTLVMHVKVRRTIDDKILFYVQVVGGLLILIGRLDEINYSRTIHTNEMFLNFEMIVSQILFPLDSKYLFTLFSLLIELRLFLLITDFTS